jgi:hypothetical protein
MSFGSGPIRPLHGIGKAQALFDEELQPKRRKPETVKSLFAAAFAAEDCKDVPQGLKPSAVRAACGTAKPVPFVHQHNSTLVAIETADDQQKQTGWCTTSEG